MTFNAHLSTVVAISGHDGTGKSTVARALFDLFEPPTLQLAQPRIAPLAQVLKLMAAAHLRTGLDTVTQKPLPDALRAYLRALGQGMRVLHGEDYWISQWVQAFGRGALAGGLTLVDDVRYENEADYFTARGGTLLCLWRPDTEPDDAQLEYPMVRSVAAVRENARAGLYGPRAHVVDVSDPVAAQGVILAALAASGLVPPAPVPTV